MQREITEQTDLLDKKGNVLYPGYARRMLVRYNRENIRSRPFALKEWDFYQLAQGDWILQTTIGHVSYAASISATLFNLRTGQRAGFGRMRPLPLRGLNMPLNPEEPNRLEVKGGDYSAAYYVSEKKRRIVFKAREKTGLVDIDITLNNDPANEKMVIVTPFKKKPNQFYLNYKENFWGGSGYFTQAAEGGGDLTVNFGADTTALIDWGRGVWPFTQEWFWGNCTAFLDGRRFGFNIGWGFGDLSHASENMVFYDGKAYKLGILDVKREGGNYMADWHFTSDDGILDLVMQPFYDNYTRTKILFIDTHCHQIHGAFSGTVRLPGGKTLELKKVTAFCEHAENRW